MYRATFPGFSRLFRNSATPLALAGILGWGVAAVAQNEPNQQNQAPAKQNEQNQAPANKSSVPDAQVEANVLKALAGASDLANQPITTTTVYGVVTLNGSVQTEAMRSEAENIVARTAGVQKVVDEMTLTNEAGAQTAENGSQNTNPNLQSDGTVAPNSEAAQNGAPPQQSPNEASGPNYGPGAPEYRQPYGGPQAPPPPGYPQQPGYAQQYPQQQYPQQQYPQQPYSQQQPYPQQPYPQQSYPQQPGYTQQQPYGSQPVYGGQVAGQMVTIPSGNLVRVRINKTLDSSHSQPGEHFDGVVVNDVVADGAVAIPRGATVEGEVVDAKSSGALAGRGELSLRLTSVTLGGKQYPLTSDIWAHNSGDKAVTTVNGTAVGTGLGALLGAAAGGGEGAAIGAGVGAAVGLGASAASGKGQVYIPAEGLLTFHIAQPTTVATVSQAEMDRLAQGAGPAGGPPRLQRRYPAYYGPAPVYYRPYPYYPYPYYRYPY